MAHYEFYHERWQRALWWMGIGVLFWGRPIREVFGPGVQLVLILLLGGQYWFRRRVKPATEMARVGFSVEPVASGEQMREVDLWRQLECARAPARKKSWAWRLGNWVRRRGKQ